MVGGGSPTALHGKTMSFIQGVVTVPLKVKILAGAKSNRNTKPDSFMNRQRDNFSKRQQGKHKTKKVLLYFKALMLETNPHRLSSLCLLCTCLSVFFLESCVYVSKQSDCGKILGIKNVFKETVKYFYMIWCTFGQRLHCDFLTVVAVTSSSYSHHPDTVLSVPSQIWDPVEIHIWRCLKLTHHLQSGEKKSLMYHWVVAVFRVHRCHAWRSMFSELVTSSVLI